MSRSLADNLLHAGTARAGITPPIGFTISGPEFGDRRSLGIDDDLFARCIVLESYGDTVAIVSLDVYAISDWLANRLKTAIADATKIPETNIIVLATCNGTSPPLWIDSGDFSSQYRNYLNYLPDVVAGAALEAKIALEPAAIGTTSTNLPNLSTFAQPNQSEDLETERETLQLTVIQNAENQIACLLYNFACPAIIVGDTRSWNADYPGVASATLEDAGIGNAIFVQGASADVVPFDWWDGNENPSHPNRSFADAQALGILLATQVVRSAPNTVTRRNAEIKTETSGDDNTTALRIGDTTLVAVNQPQHIEFAARLRSTLSETKLLISTNPVPTASATPLTLDATVQLVTQSGIYP